MRLQAWSTALVGSAVAALITAIWSREPLLFVLAALLALAAAMVAWRARQHRPRLVFVGTTTELRGVNRNPTFTGVAGGSTVGATYAATTFEPGDLPAYCAYVHVRNDPLRGEEDARNVRVSLRYTDDAGNLLCEIEGRWAHDVIAGNVERTQAPAIFDLPANGGNYKIDIGIRHLDDLEWFAWNNESKFVKPDLRHHPLGRHAFVDVSLLGSGVQAIGRFEIPNASSGQLLDTQLTTPRRHPFRAGRC